MCNPGGRHVLIRNKQNRTLTETKTQLPGRSHSLQHLTGWLCFRDTLLTSRVQRHKDQDGTTTRRRVRATEAHIQQKDTLNIRKDQWKYSKLKMSDSVSQNHEMVRKICLNQNEVMSEDEAVLIVCCTNQRLTWSSWCVHGVMLFTELIKVTTVWTVMQS